MERLERYTTLGQKDKRNILRTDAVPKGLRNPSPMDVPEQMIHLLDRSARTWNGAELVLYEPVQVDSGKPDYLEITPEEFLRSAKKSIDGKRHYKTNLLVSFTYPKGLFDLGIAQFETIPEESDAKIKLEDYNKYCNHKEMAYDWGTGMVYDGLATIDPTRGFPTKVGLAYLHYPENSESEFGIIAGRPAREGRKFDEELYPLFGDYSALSNPKKGDEFRGYGFIDSLKSLRTSMFGYPWEKRRGHSEE